MTAAAEEYKLSRVETNQRALIDKILARYATSNAVYRELLQNSNDAGAKQAEIRFTTTAANVNVSEDGTSSSSSAAAAAAAAAGVSVRKSSGTTFDANNNSKACKRPLVTKALYRNDGMPFRKEDWARLSKIAEGNPDPSKVGAFGVGAYTMFSVAEQPMVISSGQMLEFIWKGDALWTRVGPVPSELQQSLDAIDARGENPSTKWTTFVLDSRDLYAVPSLTSLGQFLASSLTFTKSLRTIRVYVDDKLEMTLTKQITRPPREIAVKSQQSKSYLSWSRGNDGGMVTSSSNGIFTLGSAQSNTSRSSRSIAAGALSLASSRSSSATTNAGGGNEDRGEGGVMESLTRLTVTVADASSSVDARYISAPVTTKISKDMAKRMERVTKKSVPPELRVEVFLAAGASEVDGAAGGGGGGGGKKVKTASSNDEIASAITGSFAPTTGTGKIFIGFQTSQTTGLAAHVSAPFIPTVEREAIDLVDPTLRIYNSELLQISGMILRLGLERAMEAISERFEAMHEVYFAEDEALIKEARAKKNNSIEEEKKEADEEEDVLTATPEDVTVSSSLMSFAKYMAKGMKSTIVSAVKQIEEVVTNDEEEELTRPLDPRPLSFEEQEAILLMRSFCAKPSTPDADIGIAVADGFTRVLPDISPPVLTRTGVVRGNDARLPKDGLEAYVHHNVVRRVVLDNAKEYHEYIAQCRLLTMRDLAMYLEDKGIHFDEYELVRFLKWWVKFNRTYPAIQYGPLVKRHITYSLTIDSEPKSLDKIYYYQERNVFSEENLPMPDSVIESSLQEIVGTRLLEDASLRNWFSPLPIDVWASFVSQHAIMTKGLASDANIRNTILAMLSKELKKQYRHGRYEGAQFEGLVRNLLSDKRCIPYDIPTPKNKKDKVADVPHDPGICTTDYASELYLASARLEAFSGISSFRKVSAELKEFGVSDDFLLSLGVRKSVSVEFLFSNLDKLNWGDNPKALVDYLRSATLTTQDLQNLRSMAYLPASNDKSRTFAPSELYIGESDLVDLNLPFIRILQWPPDEKLSVNSADGKFLLKLGCKVNPPLQPFLQHLSTQDDLTDEKRLQCLNFISKRLRPGGVYEREWTRNYSSFKKTHFLPCARKDPFGDGVIVKEMRSPEECYSDPACQIMGFIILDPEVDRKSGRTYGSSFQLASKPPPQLLLERFLEIVVTAKMLLEHAGQDEESLALRDTILSLFEETFSYLSSRSTDFNSSHMKALQRESFVPCKDDTGVVRWYKPAEVYFINTDGKEADEIVALLFHSISFSPFLASAGVKSEASVHDILYRLVTKPKEVLEKVGHEKYIYLLHRIASEPMRNISSQIRQAPFLLAYKQDVEIKEEGEDNDEKEKNDATAARPILAKAEDIYLIDNSLLGRMFSHVLHAPHETDLEHLYERLGSRYISKSVNKNHRITGRQQKETSLTREFARRMKERKALLISPKNTSRQLVKDAERYLDERTLQVIQVDGVQAVFSLGVHDKVQQVSCCASRNGRWAITLYVTEDLDFFDVGSALGDIILQRCELEDAFLLSNLIEAPLETLRARGFAVDKKVKVKEYKPPAKPKPKANEPSRPTPSATVAEPALASKSPPPASDQKDRHSKAATEGSDQGDISQSPSGESDTEDSRLARLAAEAAAAAEAVASSPAAAAAAAKAAASQAQAASASSPTNNQDPDSLRNKKRRGLRKLLGSRGGSTKMPDASQHTAASGYSETDSAGQQQHIPPSQTGRTADDNTPVSPEADAFSHEKLIEMLASSLASSRGTAATGLNSAERHMTALPEGLSRGDDGCDVIPAQNLKIFGRTTNGIKVFSSVKNGEEDSETFLRGNIQTIKIFASVLETLCEVYRLNMQSVAIYYESCGNTIAFNSNKALYFNLRLFAHLHYNDGGPLSSECYSYWFTTMAHELAHNLVSAHNKDHGYYTESYITLFLPALSAKLHRLGIGNP